MYQINGEWMNESEVASELGLVKYKDKWIDPDSIPHDEDCECDKCDPIIEVDDWIEDDETIYNPEYMEKFK